MTAADLSLGMHLTQQAGWNQTAADWQRFLDLQPDGCFVGDWDGTAVATTVNSIFDSVAWIALVLVEKSVRGRGIGTAMLHHSLEYLDRRRIATVRLDATPLGQPLYERVGFVTQYRLARYEGTLPPAPENTGVENAGAEQWEALSTLDEAVTRTNRRFVLLRLFAEQASSTRLVRDGSQPAGYFSTRPGSRAVHLGPCSTAAAVGPLLLADAWHRFAGQRVFLDVPVDNLAATRMAEVQGLTVQRYFTRMCRGVPVYEDLERLWASSGPEKG
jgi:GNAT superfamily N-acetyltransferase